MPLLMQRRVLVYNDFEVPGTHIGLAFNASVYAIIANRLAQLHSEE